MDQRNNTQTAKVDMACVRHDYEPSQLIAKAERLLGQFDSSGRVSDQDRTIANAVGVNEINSGILMCESLRESYRGFSIQFKRDLDVEFDCKSVSQKALSEVTAINFSRILDIQNRITEHLSSGQINTVGIKYLQVLSKELDRAQRHFTSSIQQLNSTKFPPIQISIKATSAVVGQNQLVQVNQ